MPGRKEERIEGKGGSKEREGEKEGKEWKEKRDGGKEVRKETRPD